MKMTRRSVASLLLLLASLNVSVGASPTAAQESAPLPFYAYYYIWFDPGSWNRAKNDFPLIGRYSSDDEQVMRAHVQWAKEAGIDGFIVSWKNTDRLSRRLQTLVKVAEDNDFELAIIYQGLDFERRPLPPERIADDLEGFIERYGSDPVFARRFGKPVVIWSGTWEFEVEEVSLVSQRVGDRLLLLGSERSLAGYERLGQFVDGNAYYWSSVDPTETPGYPDKLAEMGRSIHERGGLWFAPAAPGFDARRIGGWRVIKRAGGETLRSEIGVAIQSAPDVLGLISWNEFTENTHIEPSEDHGTSALQVLADLRGGTIPNVAEFESDAPGQTEPGGPNLVILLGLAGFVVLSLAAAILRRGRFRGRAR
jgi:glycosyl hydrolase family 99